MASSLASRTQEAKIIQRISELEQTILEMRSNQAAKLAFNGITLDGTGATGILTANSGNVVDGTGLVSTVNFPSVQIFNGAASQSTSSTSLVDVTGGSIGNIITDRTIRVIVYLMGYGYNDSLISSDLSDQMEMAFVDSSDASTIANVQIPGAAVTNVTGGGTSFTMTVGDQMVYQMAVVDVLAGSHSYKLQVKAINGGTAYLHAYLGGFIVLGT